MENRSKFYQQVQALRDVTRSNFANGQIRYQFSTQSNISWNPALSYFKIRSQIRSVASNRRDGTVPELGPPRLNDDIGPNIFFGDSLFQQLEFYINKKCINKQDNYVHQIAALRHRQSSELRNKEYNKQNFTQPDLYSRITECASGGGSDRMISQMVPLTPTFLPSSGANVSTFTSVNAVDGSNITTITFNVVNAAGAIPDLRTIFKKGQIVRYLDGTGGAPNNAANRYITREILATTATTIQVRTDAQIAVAAQPCSAVAFFLNITMPVSKGRELSKWETVWKPSLGIFKKNVWLPGGDYEIVLTPHPRNSYKLQAIESVDDKQPIISEIAFAEGEYDFEVLSMDLNICQSFSRSNKTSLYIEEIHCQSQTINTNSLSQKQFIVEPNTKALTLAYQDNRVITDTSLSTGKFKFKNEAELSLTRFYINYDGVTLPNPIPDTEYERNDIDYFTARYAETQLYKRKSLYDSTEDYEEWKARGVYFHYKWPRKSSKATQVKLSQQFKSQFEANLKPQILLFSHYTKAFTFKLDPNTGRIISIERRYD
jgi:hypothetical protein